MPYFFYKAITPQGITQSAKQEAESAVRLVEELRRSGLAVVEVTEVKSDRSATGVLTPRWHPAWLLPMSRLDVELGMQQLASMLRSGVTMLLALKTVEEQSSRPRTALVWSQLHNAIRSGGTLSDAMRQHPQTFSEDVVQLVKIGEFSGELDVVVARAAEQLESRRNLRMMVVNALVYPFIALLMALGVSGYLVAVVIPKISEFLRSGNVALPAMTQMLMNMSAWVRLNALYILIGGVSVIVTWLAVRRHPAGREAEDAILLRTPIIGRILRLSGTAAFSRGMGLLVESGVTLLDSLRVIGDMLPNRRLARRVDRVCSQVVQGESLATALEQAPEFLPMLSRMTAVAETTGTLGSTFREVARFHETLLTLTIKRFSMLIEPLMIIITGGIVGFVYIAFFMALFSMANVA